jgi:hypothetical protein
MKDFILFIFLSYYIFLTMDVKCNNMHHNLLVTLVDIYLETRIMDILLLLIIIIKKMFHLGRSIHDVEYTIGFYIRWFWGNRCMFLQFVQKRNQLVKTKQKKPPNCTTKDLIMECLACSFSTITLLVISNNFIQ